MLLGFNSSLDLQSVAESDEASYIATVRNDDGSVQKTKKNRKSTMLLRNAYHASCRECPNAFNKEAGDPRGFDESAPPTSCSECHTRTAEK